MASGLIAAALGGVGKALSTYGELEVKKKNELDLKKELLNVESEKRLREDEITRGRAFDYQKRDIEELEPSRRNNKVKEAEALLPTEVAKTTAVGKATTDVMANREDVLRPGVLKTEEGKNNLRVSLEQKLANVELDKNERKALSDATTLMDLGNNKAYTSALQKLTDAKTSSAEKTQAFAALNKMQSEKALGDLRTELSKLPDTPENAGKRATIKQQLSDLKDSKVGSYADTASLANSYLVASNTILRNGSNTEEELAEAKRLRDLGERIGEAIIDKKIPEAKNTPAKADTSGYKLNEERIISDGANKGKTVVWDGTKWNLKK